MHARAELESAPENWWLIYPKGFCLFAAPDDDLALGQAKDYITEQGMSSETVRIAQVPGKYITVQRK